MFPNIFGFQTYYLITHTHTTTSVCISMNGMNGKHRIDESNHWWNVVFIASLYGLRDGIAPFNLNQRGTMKKRNILNCLAFAFVEMRLCVRVVLYTERHLNKTTIIQVFPLFCFPLATSLWWYVGRVVSYMLRFIYFSAPVNVYVSTFVSFSTFNHQVSHSQFINMCIYMCCKRDPFFFILWVIHSNLNV